MYESSHLRIFTSISHALIYIFPLVILGRENYGGVILLLLTLLGGYVVFKDNINPFKHKQLRLISIISFFYFFSIILFIALSKKLVTDIFYHSPGLVFFLFAPLISLAIYKANIDFGKFISVIKIGLILIGLYALYKSTKTTLPTDRILWVSHIGSMLLVFSWININHEKKYHFLLTLISSILAINAILLAGFRGHILALFILSTLFLLLNNKYSINNQRNNLFAAFLVLITILLIQFNPNVKDRFIDAAYNLQEWSNITIFNIEARNVVEKNINTSTGQRMEMYKTGLMAFKEKKIFGHGYLNTTSAASNFAKNEYVKKAIIQHTHLHNTYIDSLVFGGVTALLVVLILLLSPLLVFIQAFKNKQNTEHATLGILLVTSYLLLGLTDTMIGGIFENTFYVFFLSIFLSKVTSE